MESQAFGKPNSKQRKAGIDRLSKFGMMNSIMDLCEQYPAYKFDDIFNWPYSLYFIAVEKNSIANEIRNNLSEQD